MNNDMIDRMIDIASGTAEPESGDLESRGTRRHEHDAVMGFVQRTPDGGKSIPTLVRSKNISPTGMCIISRYMLHVGHEGVVLMTRTNGAEVLLGVKVVHCVYVGEMKHESGFEFIEVPVDFSMEDFIDEHGNMIRLDSAKAA